MTWKTTRTILRRVAWAGLGLTLLLLLGGLGTSGLSYLGWAHHQAHFASRERLFADPTPDRVVAGTGLVVREGLGLAAAAALTPLGFASDPFALGRRAGARRPVVLVHGYLRNRSAWYAYGTALRAAGWTEVYTVNLHPADAELDDFAQQVQREVDAILAHSPHDHVDLVCHSMGGVVGRAYIQRFGGRERVANLITLGSPHHGSVLAPLAPTANAMDLAPEAAYLADLNADPAAMTPVAVTAIYTKHDNKVMPAESAALPAPARTIALEGLGHVSLLWSPQVYAVMYQTLQSSTVSTADASA